jgi:hypothetical protein
MKFEVLTAAKISELVFWVVMPCSAPKMEAVRSSETFYLPISPHGFTTQKSSIYELQNVFVVPHVTVRHSQTTAAIANVAPSSSLPLQAKVNDAPLALASVHLKVHSHL